MGIVIASRYVVCNECGRREGPFRSQDKAEDFIVENGWIWYLAANETYCPMCKAKRTERKD